MKISEKLNWSLIIMASGILLYYVVDFYATRKHLACLCVSDLSHDYCDSLGVLLLSTAEVLIIAVAIVFSLYGIVLGWIKLGEYLNNLEDNEEIQ